MKTVSIIVPVYNVESYLRQCLDSIADQSYRDLEVILVDDGSPDNCGRICDEYAEKDSRFHVIHQKNSGVSKARNAALELVSGKYLTFCDSDDRYMPDWIRGLVSAIETADADMALGGFTRIVEEEKINCRTHKAGIINCSTMEQKLDYCVNGILDCYHGWEVAVRLFRTDIIRGNNIRFCETCQNFAEDLGFTLEYVLCASRIAVTADAGYLYTMRSGSMMHSSAGKVKLNSTNEVALSVMKRIEDCFGISDTKGILPVFHYLIMDVQYQAVIACGQYRHFHEHIRHIQRYSEWRRWTRQVIHCRKELQALVGTQRMRWILLATSYHLSGIWPIFALGNELLEWADKRFE